MLPSATVYGPPALAVEGALVMEITAVLVVEVPSRVGDAQCHGNRGGTSESGGVEGGAGPSQYREYCPSIRRERDRLNVV